MIQDILTKYYDKNNTNNYKVYEILDVPLNKQSNYEIAKIIISGGVYSNRLDSTSAQNILGSIENLNKQIIINSDLINEPTYEYTIGNLQYHLSKKAIVAYRFAGLDEQFTENLNI